MLNHQETLEEQQRLTQKIQEEKLEKYRSQKKILEMQKMINELEKQVNEK